MIQKYLILVDENPQKETLKSIKNVLRSDGIDLIYEEFNPTNYIIRDSNGVLNFDEVTFKSNIEKLEYFNYTDVILSDYNLVPEVINGYRIIEIFRELKFNQKKKIILYSAKIETVISEILNNSEDFEVQKQNLVKLISNNIEFIKRDGYLDEVIKTIKQEADFDFETELIKWFHKRNKDTFNYLFPKYKGKSFKEIAIEFENKSHTSLEFKKELIEQIIAYLSNINELDNE